MSAVATQTQQEQHTCITKEDCETLATLEKEYGVPEIGMPEEDEKLLQSIREAIASCTKCKAVHFSN